MMAPRRGGWRGLAAGITLSILVNTGTDAGEGCILEQLETAPDTATVGEIRRLCDLGPDPGQSRRSMVGHRRALERHGDANPFVLTAHRPNYLLPLTWVDLPARDDGTGKHDVEVQFQLSQKVLLIEDALLGHGDLYGAYTNRSFWQAYSRGRSSPFRETNHEPELILTFDSRIKLGGGFRLAGHHLILNHQSNGRSGAASRSWNRIILSALLERDNLVVAIRPWWRIPERSKHSPSDARGDDNPDIENYIGRIEVTTAWTRREHLYTVTLRNSLRPDRPRGSVELSWSIPIHGHIRGTVRYFSGYGESLVNHRRTSQSLGIGFLVADWL